MLLSPHKSAESKVFADVHKHTFADFIEAGEQLGIQEAVLAYMDEAQKSGKTMTEFCEEVVASYANNPWLTKRAMDDIKLCDFHVQSDGKFSFDPTIQTSFGQRDPMTITAHFDDERVSHPLTNHATISFETAGYGKIEQISEKSAWTVTEPSGLGRFGQMMSECTIQETDGVAKLDKNGHVFDVTDKIYDSDDRNHANPSTFREIVFDNGETFTLDQQAPGRVTEVVDQDGNHAYLDGDIDPAEVSYDDIKAALHGNAEIGDETQGFDLGSAFGVPEFDSNDFDISLDD